MAQPEGKLSRKIQKEMKKRGAWVFKVHGSEYQPAGIPDIIGVYRGQFIGVESKMPGNKPTDIQRFRMAQIDKAGGICVVAYTVDEALELLDIVDGMHDGTI